MLYHYRKKWNVQNYTPPAKWMVCSDARTGKSLAAMGFTVSPDGRIVYFADLLCLPTREGKRAMLYLVDEFIKSALARGVETVCAQCMYGNDVMRRFIERRCRMRPLSVVYAVTRKEYEEHGRR